MAEPSAPTLPNTARSGAPIALVVFLENLGHVSGVKLPSWMPPVIDFVAEEYVKLALRLHGVYRAYDRVLILEDARATGPDLRAALIGLSRTHTVDLMILAHGLPGQIIGYKGKPIGEETFAPLLAAYRSNPQSVRLRMVWQMNCYGASLIGYWRELGAAAVMGSSGVNWLPEPTLSLFVRKWLRGASFSEAVYTSATRAEREWHAVYRARHGAPLHPRLASSRPIIAGDDVALIGGRAAPPRA